MLVVYAMGFVSEQGIAEDLVQELIISVWEQDNNFINIKAFKSYLYNSVKNKCINYLRHLDVKDKYVQTILSDAENTAMPEEEAEEQEMYRMVMKVIDALPERCKQVFELQMQGRKNKEIAEMLQISIETVKTQKKRAMKRLKDQLGPGIVLLFLNI